MKATSTNLAYEWDALPHITAQDLCVGARVSPALANVPWAMIANRDQMRLMVAWKARLGVVTVLK